MSFDYLFEFGCLYLRGHQCCGQLFLNISCTRLVPYTYAQTFCENSIVGCIDFQKHILDLNARSANGLQLDLFVLEHLPE
jgi:hypothetical protein